MVKFHHERFKLLFQIISSGGILIIYILVAFISCIILYYTYYTFSFNFFCLEILKGFAAGYVKIRLTKFLGISLGQRRRLTLQLPVPGPFLTRIITFFTRRGPKLLRNRDRLGKGGWGLVCRMFLICGKITLYLCQPYSHVDPWTLFFLLHNPISF